MKTIIDNLKYLQTINLGFFIISGRYNLDYNLWHKGYRIRVIFKYFLIYEKL